EAPDVAALLELADMDLELITWDNGTTELCAIYGHEIHERRGIFPGRTDTDCTGCLRHRLDDQHAWHDRVRRKMSLEMRFVCRDVLDADRGIVAVDVDDAIDQQERIA